MTTTISVPDDARVYEKSTVMNTTIEQMIAFHEDPSALSKLTPPPVFAQLLDDQRRSFSDGDLIFRLWLGPIPVRWHARHQAGPTPASFTDVMIAGPMRFWQHDHIFTDLGDGKVRLTDRVTVAHKNGWRGWLTRLVFDGIPLRLLFFYRHLRTRLAVSH